LVDGAARQLPEHDLCWLWLGLSLRGQLQHWHRVGRQRQALLRPDGHGIRKTAFQFDYLCPQPAQGIRGLLHAVRRVYLESDELTWPGKYQAWATNKSQPSLLSPITRRATA